VIARVLAIPPKRFTRAVVSCLTDEEAAALTCAAPAKAASNAARRSPAR
jgi:hypothetical protein